MIGNASTSIFVAIIVLGIIIVIHELGHFLVAKFFGIKVETFSVGFGPRLIGFKKGDTDYRISAFPLGGYVKMAGETPLDTITGEAYEFLSKPKWQRFLVAAAGPAMNVILAVGLITGLYIYGTDVPEFLIGQAIINVVEPASPAEKAGIKPGDQIVSLDGKDKPDWQDVQNTILTSPGRPLPIVVERDGKQLRFTLTPERRGREEAGDVGMFPVFRTLVQDVQPNTPALRAGVRPGDEIIRVNGIDLRTSGRTLQQTIQQMPEKTFPITVLRSENPTAPAAAAQQPGFFSSKWNSVLRLFGRNSPATDVVNTGLGDAHQGQAGPPPSPPKEVELQVTPEMRDGRRIIGIGIQTPSVHVKLGVTDAFVKSIQSNKENAVLIFQVIGRLLRREASLKQLDGPVGIVAVSGQAYAAGFATLLTFMALISLNLGVLNILPIPILDGGVILLLVIESLMGRDLSLRMKERIVQASFVFLLMLTVVVLYNDVVKLLPVLAADSMKALAPEMQVFMEYLQERKLKLTPHRQLILDIFLNHEGHRSIEDIYRVVRVPDPRVGYTTVYRTMKILLDCGLAREIDLADGITRYEHLYNHQHHDHMVCMQCGKSIEFYNPEIETVQDEASEQLGFKVLDHKLQIYGLCGDCRKG